MPEDPIAIPADPNAPKDRDVSVADLERAQRARLIHKTRISIGLSQVNSWSASVSP